ncbi:hypothetical protein evm_014077 [Chilo suppressalis]|nr:hypothetical protein evm_014077 [Chilo suppressalis]
MDATVPRVLLSIALAALLPIATSQDQLAKENIPHSRQKRILWITNDGRLALPPGTSMAITPSLSMPFVRHPPKGFLSNVTISFPFTIDFDKLGLTDNENPYGSFPPILARSMGQAALSMMTDYVGQYLDRRRGKRSDDGHIHPDVEAAVLDRLHGGESLTEYSEYNMMDAWNLAICLGPTLLAAWGEGGAQVTAQNLVNELVKRVILHHHSLFPQDIAPHTLYTRQTSRPIRCTPGSEYIPTLLPSAWAPEPRQRAREAGHPAPSLPLPPGHRAPYAVHQAVSISLHYCHLPGLQNLVNELVKRVILHHHSLFPQDIAPHTLYTRQTSRPIRCTPGSEYIPTLLPSAWAPEPRQRAREAGHPAPSLPLPPGHRAPYAVHQAVSISLHYCHLPGLQNLVNELVKRVILHHHSLFPQDIAPHTLYTRQTSRPIRCTPGSEYIPTLLPSAWAPEPRQRAREAGHPAPSLPLPPGHRAPYAVHQAVSISLHYCHLPGLQNLVNELVKRVILHHHSLFPQDIAPHTLYTRQTSRPIRCTPGSEYIPTLLPSAWAPEPRQRAREAGHPAPSLPLPPGHRAPYAVHQAVSISLHYCHLPGLQNLVNELVKRVILHHHSLFPQDIAPHTLYTRQTSRPIRCTPGSEYIPTLLPSAWAPEPRQRAREAGHPAPSLPLPPGHRAPYAVHQAVSISLHYCHLPGLQNLVNELVKRVILHHHSLFPQDIAPHTLYTRQTSRPIRCTPGSEYIPTLLPSAWAPEPRQRAREAGHPAPSLPLPPGHRAPYAVHQAVSISLHYCHLPGLQNLVNELVKRVILHHHSLFPQDIAPHTLYTRQTSRPIRCTPGSEYIPTLLPSAWAPEPRQRAREAGHPAPSLPLPPGHRAPYAVHQAVSISLHYCHLPGLQNLVNELVKRVILHHHSLFPQDIAPHTLYTRQTSRPIRCTPGSEYIPTLLPSAWAPEPRQRAREAGHPAPSLPLPPGHRAPYAVHQAVSISLHYCHLPGLQNLVNELVKRVILHHHSLFPQDIAPHTLYTRQTSRPIRCTPGSEYIPTLLPSAWAPEPRQRAREAGHPAPSLPLPPGHRAPYAVHQAVSISLHYCHLPGLQNLVNELVKRVILHHHSLFPQDIAPHTLYTRQTSRPIRCTPGSEYIPTLLPSAWAPEPRQRAREAGHPAPSLPLPPGHRAPYAVHQAVSISLHYCHLPGLQNLVNELVKRVILHHHSLFPQDIAPHTLYTRQTSRPIRCTPGSEYIPTLLPSAWAPEPRQRAREAGHPAPSLPLPPGHRAPYAVHQAVSISLHYCHLPGLQNLVNELVKRVILHHHSLFPQDIAPHTLYTRQTSRPIRCTPGSEYIPTLLPSAWAPEPRQRAREAGHPAPSLPLPPGHRAPYAVHQAVSISLHYCHLPGLQNLVNELVKRVILHHHSLFPQDIAPHTLYTRQTSRPIRCTPGSEYIPTLLPSAWAPEPRQRAREAGHPAPSLPLPPGHRAPYAVHQAVSISLHYCHLPGLQNLVNELVKRVILHHHSLFPQDIAPHTLYTRQTSRPIRCTPGSEYIPTLLPSAWAPEPRQRAREAGHPAPSLPLPPGHRAPYAVHQAVSISLHYCHLPGLQNLVNELVKRVILHHHSLFPQDIAPHTLYTRQTSRPIRCTPGSEYIPTLLPSAWAPEPRQRAREAGHPAPSLPLPPGHRAPYAVHQAVSISLHYCHLPGLQNLVNELVKRVILHHHSLFPQDIAPHTLYTRQTSRPIRCTPGSEYIPTLLPSAWAPEPRQRAREAGHPAPSLPLPPGHRAPYAVHQAVSISLHYCHLPGLQNLVNELVKRVILHHHSLFPQDIAPHTLYTRQTSRPIRCTPGSEYIPTLLPSAWAPEPRQRAREAGHPAPSLPLPPGHRAPYAVHQAVSISLHYCHLPGLQNLVNELVKRVILHHHSLFPQDIAPHTLYTRQTSRPIRCTPGSEYIPTLLPSAWAPEPRQRAREAGHPAPSLPLPPGHRAPYAVHQAVSISLHYCHLPGLQNLVNELVKRVILHHHSLFPQDIAPHTLYTRQTSRPIRCTPGSEYIPTLLPSAWAPEPRQRAREAGHPAPSLPLPPGHRAPYAVHQAVSISLHYCHLPGLQNLVNELVKRVILHHHSLFPQDIAPHTLYTRQTSRPIRCTPGSEYIPTLLPSAWAPEPRQRAREAGHPAPSLPLPPGHRAPYAVHQAVSISLHYCHLPGLQNLVNELVKRVILHHHSLFPQDIAPHTLYTRQTSRPIRCTPGSEYIPTLLPSAWAPEPRQRAREAGHPAPSLPLPPGHRAPYAVHQAVSISLHYCHLPGLQNLVNELVKRVILHHHSLFPQDIAPHTLYTRQTSRPIRCTPGSEYIPTLLPSAWAPEPRQRAREAGHPAPSLPLPPGHRAPYAVHQAVSISLHYCHLPGLQNLVNELVKRVILHHHSLFPQDIAPHTLYTRQTSRPIRCTPGSEYIPTLLPSAWAPEPRQRAREAGHPAPSLPLPPGHRAPYAVHQAVSISLHYCHLPGLQNLVNELVKRVILHHHSLFPQDIAPHTLYTRQTSRPIRCTPGSEYIPTLLPSAWAPEPRQRAREAGHPAPSLPLPPGHRAPYAVHQAVSISLHYCHLPGLQNLVNELVKRVILHHHSLFPQDIAPHTLYTRQTSRPIRCTPGSEYIPTLLPSAWAPEPRQRAREAGHPAPSLPLPPGHRAPYAVHQAVSISLHYCHLPGLQNLVNELVKRVILHHHSLFPQDIAPHTLYTRQTSRPIRCTPGSEYIPTLLPSAWAPEPRQRAREAGHPAPSLPLPPGHRAPYAVHQAVSISLHYCHLPGLQNLVNELVKRVILHHHSLFPQDIAPHTLYTRQTSRPIRCTPGSEYIPTLLPSAWAPEPRQRAREAGHPAPSLPLPPGHRAPYAVHQAVSISLHYCHLPGLQNLVNELVKRVILHHHSLFPQDIAPHTLYTRQTSRPIRCTPGSEYIPTLLPSAWAPEPRQRAREAGHPAPSLPLPPGHRAPYAVHQATSSGYITTEKDDIEGKFAPLLLQLSLKLSASSHLKQVPYDSYCPSVEGYLCKGSCGFCGLYFASYKATNQHKQLHKIKQDEVPIAKIRPQRIAARRAREILCLDINDDALWLDEKDVDTTNVPDVKNEVNCEVTAMPVINNLKDWVQSPWTEDD